MISHRLISILKRQSMILVYLFITTHTLDWSIHAYDEACTHKQIYQELKCPTSWDQWRCNSAVVRAGLSLFLSPIRTRNKVNMSTLGLSDPLHGRQGGIRLWLVCVIFSLIIHCTILMGRSCHVLFLHSLSSVTSFTTKHFHFLFHLAVSSIVDLTIKWENSVFWINDLDKTIGENTI